MIEAGGTKFNCAVGTAHDKILAETRIATSTPEETLAVTVDFFRDAATEYGSLDALGIASFGPLELDKASPHYGYITRTPKPHWSHTDMLGILGRELSVASAIDTDVNCAALSEAKWGAAKGTNSSIYVTVGTGIGAGIIVDGKLLHGINHPEVGHMVVGIAAEDTNFKGTCSFHSDCLTSFAVGPAIEARWGTRAENLPPNHEAWRLEADYLAAMCLNLTFTLAPEKIILAGGVMEQLHLIDLVRDRFLKKVGGYLAQFDHRQDIDSYIVGPKLQKSGLSGAFLMAERAFGLKDQAL